MQTLPRDTNSTPAAIGRPASFFLPGLLALEGGTVHRGRLRGAAVPAEGDLIFTTAATGWGEILTDPSYAGQVVVLTHPMAGNYRIRPDELESDRVQLRGLVVTRLVTPPPGDGHSLEEMLLAAGVPAIEGVDTRAITLELRRGAARRAVICPTQGRVTAADEAAAVAAALASAPWESVDHVAGVATRDPYVLGSSAPYGALGRAVLVDFGVKRSLLSALTERGLAVTVLPPDATLSDVEAHAPDLVVLSPGPGDPARMAPQIAAVAGMARRAVEGGPPILGICLGHQLLALAAGAETRRLPVGHHGGNHAVLELATARVDIGAHNHEVGVLDDEALTAAGYRVSHRDLNDGTVEGLVHASGRIVSVQFHPEGAPGPVDASRVFDLAVQSARA
jgi:carbamoyl-phosphate synthase small subunit